MSLYPSKNKPNSNCTQIKSRTWVRLFIKKIYRGRFIAFLNSQPGKPQRHLVLHPYPCHPASSQLDKLHHVAHGIVVHQPYESFRQHFDPMADHLLPGDEQCLLYR